MPLIAGVLLALGIAALLAAGVLVWPYSPLAAAAVALGSAALILSWGLVMVRSARIEEAMDAIRERLHDRDSALRNTRAALGDAEQTLQARTPAAAVAPLLAEVLERTRKLSDPQRIVPLLATYEGLATPGEAQPVSLEHLLSRSRELAGAVLGTELSIEPHLEPHGPVALDRSRVIAMMVQVLAAAHSADTLTIAPIRVEMAEWQAGLLRVRVVASGVPPRADSRREAGLLLAAANARVLGGSLDWEQDDDLGQVRFVMLIPLEEADVRTDPTPPLRERRP